MDQTKEMPMRLSSLLNVILSTIVLASNGAISGTVFSSVTLDPLPGAYVIIEGTETGAVTDNTGSFVIRDVPVGGYVLRAASVGFHPVMKPDVIVRSGRTTSVEFPLEYSVLDGGVIYVTPDYFTEDHGEPVSRIQFSGEQVRRSPGSAGDVSRVISSLPSVAKVDDQYNGMPVRGGNPMENGIYIDGIQIPNINHFPRQGTSGGGLGMINTDLIEDVRFSAGGFSPAFGNRLSSVMEVEIREGNREEFDGQIDLSMSGFGTVLEGPMEKGSWLVCARRSYVDLLVDIADIDALPTYSDFQAKVAYDLNQAHRITFSGLGADDYVDYTWEQAFEDGNDNYGVTDNWNLTAGLGWRWVWPGDGFSNTTVSFTGIHYGGDYFNTVSQNVQAVQNSTERSVTLRNVNSFSPGENLTVDFGLDARQTSNRFDNFYGADTSWSGDYMPEIHTDISSRNLSGGVFASGSVLLSHEITLTAGIRGDHNGVNGETRVSPRGSLSWEPVQGTAVSASAGIYRQSLPSELISRDEAFSYLEDPSSFHGVVSFRHLLAEEMKLQIEGYSKIYSGFPWDPQQPGYFILDGVSSEQDLYAFTGLESGGEARAYGIEATLQKQLVSGYYGLIAGSCSVSEYRNPGELWRRRIFDNGWTATLEGGYRVSEKWEFSCRWLAAGGRPYTPLDIQSSQEQNRTILDSSRINGERYPWYSSVNIRADRRFNFSESSLVCYASIWNLFNRQNTTATYWNRIENKEDNIYQWGLMPIIGIEYEF